MDKLYKAMIRWYAARTAHDKALGDYDGYSWGYAGAAEIEELQAAAKEFEDALQEIINKGVKAALAADAEQKT
jgi:hypothetical protein